MSGPVCVPSRAVFLAAGASAGLVTVAASRTTPVSQAWHAFVNAVVPVVLFMFAAGFVFGSVALCRTLAACRRRAHVPGRVPGTGPQERAQDPAGK